MAYEYRPFGKAPPARLDGYRGPVAAYQGTLVRGDEAAGEQG